MSGINIMHENLLKCQSSVLREGSRGGMMHDCCSNLTHLVAWHGVTWCGVA